MERVKDTPNTIDIFENDIDLYLHQFQEEQGIEDLRAVPQAVWNGALRYIYRHTFKGNDQLLKSNNIYNISDNNIPSNCNMYNYSLVNELADYYIYLCQIYNKEISIIGFSNLTGIDNDTFYNWANNYNKLSTAGFDIYKKLSAMREESLSNKLADGKQNPVGVIAILNRNYGWASPYTADANKGRRALTDSELPKLSGNGTQFIEKKSE
jgi:hypothetical protein